VNAHINVRKNRPVIIIVVLWIYLLFNVLRSLLRWVTITTVTAVPITQVGQLTHNELMTRPELCSWLSEIEPKLVLAYPSTAT